MARSFVLMLVMLVTFFASSPAFAQAKWIYKGSGKPDESSTVAIIVAVDRYYVHTELDDIRQDVADKGQRLAQEFAEWDDFSHIILLSGANAKKAPIEEVIGQMPNVQRIVFVWIGLGGGNDTGSPVFYPADVQDSTIESSVIYASSLKESLMERAKDVDILVDPSAPGQFMKLAFLGPDATAFQSGPCSSCYVLSTAKGRSLPPSDGFVNEIIAVLTTERSPSGDGKVTYGQMFAALEAVNFTPDRTAQGVSANDIFLERPAAPMIVEATPIVVGTPEPLPTSAVVTEPRRKPKAASDKPGFKPDWRAAAMGAAGVGLTAFGAVEAKQALELHETMNSEADIIAYYGGHGSWDADNAALQEGEDARALSAGLSAGSGVVGLVLITVALSIQF